MLWNTIEFKNGGPTRTRLPLADSLAIALDHGTQAPVALAPLIDPNMHSCGSVRPHGAEELKHPDAGVFIVGMKSYGRAPTFLLLTGYEQVRSAVAAVAGDWESARRVELVLPETGVCITQFAEEDAAEAASSCCGTARSKVVEPVAEETSGCCGGPAPRKPTPAVFATPKRKLKASRGAVVARRRHR